MKKIGPRKEKAIPYKRSSTFCANPELATSSLKNKPEVQADCHTYRKWNHGTHQGYLQRASQGLEKLTRFSIHPRMEHEEKDAGLCQDFYDLAGFNLSQDGRPENYPHEGSPLIVGSPILRNITAILQATTIRINSCLKTGSVSKYSFPYRQYYNGIKI